MLFFTGFVNGDSSDGKDTGPYESSEAKVMNNSLQVKFTPVPDEVVSTISNGLFRRLGQSTDGYLIESERTSL